ncbi:arylsulfatase [Flammeovirga agarivorans]|uniref:Arylsulfatase n=1 Tax=Flammeovirga agarivorans TaxID=2726742 RepID=A0A7X8SPM3_9BACT|nr:arylsulfatase [Flammeovirga agarivorans]NLR94078.1 arylsulfatase [Flammeovirga agarivorans]
MKRLLAFYLILSSFAVFGQSRPNVVFILTDDQGYGDLGVTGNPHISTPNIDKLANENITLDHFLVNAVCAPTRASLLTGRYNLATGVNWVTRRKEVMNADEVTLAELFKSNNYKTGLFGKWHNGSTYPHNPVGQGFETFFGFCAGHWNNYFDTELENEKGEFVKTEGYITDVLTDHAIDFIKENKDENFFCFVPYNAPHAPFQVGDEYYEKYEKMGLDERTAAVYGMCENIDDNVGRLIATLKEEGLWDNTIFIYSSDNGPNGERYNAQMKGKKATVHEGGVRVPMFIKAPNYHVTKVEELTAHIDIFPTLAELCDIEVPDSIQLHGKSILPLLDGKNKQWEDRVIYTHNQPWKFEETPAAAVRSEQYRLVMSKENDTTLYDMNVDPSQLHDLSASNAEVVNKMTSDYHRWFMDITNGGKEPAAERIQIGHKEAPKTVLTAVDGNTKNKVRYEGKGWSNEWAKNFKNKKGVIQWDVKIVEDGEYNFDMLYSCSEEYIGFNIMIEVGEKVITKKMSKPFETKQLVSPDREARTEVHEFTWGTMQMGKLFLKKGKYKVKVRVNNEINPSNNFRLKELVVNSTQQS